MSCKLSLNNSIKLNNEPPQWLKSGSTDSGVVKFAGDESKDRLYEPKHKKKLVRVLTVVAYVFFVSLAAIMLSLYYVFLWNGNEKNGGKTYGHYSQSHTVVCKNGENILVDVAYEPTAIPVLDAIGTTPGIPKLLHMNTMPYHKLEHTSISSATEEYVSKLRSNKNNTKIEQEVMLADDANFDGYRSEILLNALLRRRAEQ